MLQRRRGRCMVARGFELDLKMVNERSMVGVVWDVDLG